jgi:dTDP-4-dehydrorhamnose reductase
MLSQIVTNIVKQCSSNFPVKFAEIGGILNVAASGQASWFDFATAIVEGLKSRGVALKVEKVTPRKTADYPTRATRPKNSRFDLTRLAQQFDITPPHWVEALAIELNQLAREMKGG